jgi:serine/threonine protein kinase
LTLLPLAADLPALPELPWPAAEDPSLARVLEIVSSDQGLVLVSELALGPPLGALTAFQQPPQLVALLLAQAMEGLSVLHRAGRAHGALSPEAFVIDPRVHRVRMVDLWSSWIPQPRTEQLRAYCAPELWERSFPASEADRVRGDVYAMGRLAEALLSGGPPMGAWQPLVPGPRLTDEARRSFTMLSAWSARCQATAPSDRPQDAAAALEALRPLPVEGEVALARAAASLRLPYFTQVERALRSWSRTRSSAPDGGALSYLGAVSSFRASLLWKGLASAAVAIVVASVGLAVRPLPAAAGQWPAGACLDSARPQVLEGPDAGGPSVLRLAGPAPEQFAIDGCPVAASPGLRLALAPGTHQLRVEATGRKIGLAVEIDAGSELDLGIEGLPIATGNGADAIASFRGGLRKLTDRTAGLRANPSSPAIDDSPPPAETAYAQALIEPATRDLLDLDLRLIDPSPAARANLPDGLALWLDALRAAASRFEVGESACNRRARQQVRTLLDQRQPEAAPKLSDAIEALAVDRILATEEANRPDEETAILKSLGVTDSPMLQRAVHDLVLDPELRRCVETLRPIATDLKTLADSQLVEYGEWTAWAHQP